jgi:cytochrome c2
MNQIVSIVIFFALIFVACTSNTHSDSLTSEINQAENIHLIFDIDSLLTLQELDTIHIKHDRVTKEVNKRFLGISTETLFSQLISNHRIDSKGKEVIFLCKDGYSARVSLNQLLTNKGFLVNKDIDAKLQWDDDISAKFAPAYLVWDVDKDDHNYVFPYGILKIKITSIDDEYKDITPLNASQKLLSGFSLFKKHCIRCHSINKVGGDVGPELNIPMNVTEYWKNDHLERFITNPKLYRYNSKMPTLSDMKSNEVASIIEYLAYMSENKK